MHCSIFKKSFKTMRILNSTQVPLPLFYAWIIVEYEYINVKKKKGGGKIAFFSFFQK